MSLFEARPLPWHVKNPYDGCNADEPEHNHMQCSVWDNDGNLVCECMGEDEGRQDERRVPRLVIESCAECRETWINHGASGTVEAATVAGSIGRRRFDRTGVPPERLAL